MTTGKIRGAGVVSAIAASVLAALGAGAGCYPDYEGPGIDSGPAATTTPQGIADAASAGTGLPCAVQALLEDHCQSCHSRRPSAPMPLVTHADLMAKAPSDPKKRVVDVALARLESASSPMPPSGLLDPTDVAGFAQWVKSGATQSSCTAASLWEGGASTGPECTVKSDCPGSLTCVGGVCVGERPPGPPPDSTTMDAGADGATTTEYADPTSMASWTLVNLTAFPTASTYNGATFDGRYVYFAPDGADAIALRFDTTAPYADVASWSTYSLTGRNGAAAGYRGAAFDGRYVYFVPSTASALLARFDTQGAFGDDAMWTLFDLNAVGAKGGLQGATFDGRYIYFVPTSSTALRYDTTAELTLAASWSKNDFITVDPKAYGYVGAVFDGRYVYYVPSAHGTVPHGNVTRFDVQGEFAAASSWTTFDLATIAPGATGFRTAAFDGRHVYLVPGWTAPTPAWSQSTIARLDTGASFTAAASWTLFDTRTLDLNATGYNSATFDGRFMVFAPGYDSTSAAYHGHTLVYDTSAPLDANASWARSDTKQLSRTQVNLRGAAFDGQYMYFAPRAGWGSRLKRRGVPRAAPFPVMGGSFY